MDRAPLLVVAGAPGVGKSTVIPRLAALRNGFVAVDMDELLDDDGAVLGLTIASDGAAELWPAYNKLWLANIGLILRSGVPVVFSTPMTPGEVDAALPDGFDHPIAWALLDCADAERTARLQRRGWSADRIGYALADARELRGMIPTVVGTDGLPPDQVAQALRKWVAETTGAGSGRV